jgi:hypothetical protein
MLKASGGRKPRGSRWYGSQFRGNNRKSADLHPEADEWAIPQRHAQLLEQLEAEYDGWAIATAPDALEIYSPLPVGVRIAVWVKPNGIPGSHRLRSVWEPIIIRVPSTRQRNIGRGAIPDVVTAPAPRLGFPGAKPEEWTHWILRAFSFDPAIDTVCDMFPGSGAVTRAISSYGRFETLKLIDGFDA